MTKKEEIIEAIEILKKERRVYIVDGRERKLDWAIDMAIDALQFKDIMVNNPKTAKPTPEVCKNCKDNTQDDWIPFSDDSVAPGYEVMCQDRYGNMMLGYAWVDEYGIWVCEDDNIMMDDVVAWRPKPKPYKGGDTE